MLTVLWIVLLGISAGWLVTLTADTFPARRAVRETWRWPLQQLGLLDKPARTVQPGEAVALPRAGRYLLVWLVAVLLGWLAYVQLGWTGRALLSAGEAWFFLAIAVIDLEQRLVLNRMLLGALPLLLAVNLMLGVIALPSALLGALVGFGLFLLIALLVPGGMGMGDVKLAGLIGLTTGLAGVMPALLIGILSGGLASLVILLATGFRRGQTIAYAPYLVVGVWFVLFDGSRFLYTYRF